MNVIMLLCGEVVLASENKTTKTTLGAPPDIMSGGFADAAKRRPPTSRAAVLAPLLGPMP